MTVAEKNDHLAQVLDIEILVPHCSTLCTYAMVKSESRYRIPFLSNARPGTGTREIIFSRTRLICFPYTIDIIAPSIISMRILC